MDFCTDSSFIIAVEYLKTAMAAYGLVFAVAGVLALLALVCMLCMNDRPE